MCVRVGQEHNCRPHNDIHPADIISSVSKKKSAKKSPGKSPAVSPEDRAAILERNRQLKMARSAHAYVRGSTVHFYDWLNRAHKDSLPEGPPIWICGDCHVGNIGPLANAEGKVEIEIRDLDQTVVGNPAHDLVRLALSLAMAARGSDLPGVTTTHMVEHLIEGYTAALRHPIATLAADAKGDNLDPIQAVLKAALRRRWKNLAEERIEDVKPEIPLNDRFWTVAEPERQAIEALFAEDAARRLITQLKGRDDNAKVKVVDAAYWMKGCSSLGKLRFAVLLAVGKGADRRHCLVDIKEAIAPAAPATKPSALKPESPRMPTDFAERVVCGARALSPFLGQRMLAAHLLRRPVVIRELMPQDLKFNFDTLTCDQAIATARFLAAVVGKAHGRQMNAPTRKRWLNELKLHHTKSLEAPSWLWSSMVSLVSEHEAAYLNHCRRYAQQ